MLILEMKRSEILASTLLVPIDAAAILGGFWLAYYTRVESGALPVAYVLPFDRFTKISIAITLVWLVIFALFGLYTLRSTRRGLGEFSRLLGAVTVGTLTVIAVIFFLRVDFFSRFVILAAFFFSLGLTVSGRALMRAVQRGLFRYGIGVRRAVIIGTNRTAEVLARELKTSERGYRILGFISSDRKKKGLGSIKDLRQVLELLRPDEIIDADPKLSDAQKLEMITAAEDFQADFRFTSDLSALATTKVDTAAVAGIPLMTLRHTPLEGWGRVAKRLMDLAGSLVALPFIALLFPFIALAIKLDSRGPVIFRQTRVGKGGREFAYYKFRSMVVDAERRRAALEAKNEASGPVFKMKRDPRITRVGSFLRRTSLDELPQFLNVLKGDMSLVGPRPPLPSEVAKYTREQRRRLTIKPGITGPWQVSGRSDVDFEEWVKLDVYYIQNWSILLDITILLKTVAAVVSRRGAY